MMMMVMIEEKAIYTASQIPFLQYTKKRHESCQKLLTTDIQVIMVRREMKTSFTTRAIRKKWLGILPFWGVQDKYVCL